MNPTWETQRTMQTNTDRIQVIDALRGFAILSIMLLHNIEHFDLYHFPESSPSWLKGLDSGVWSTLFFLFGGKSYAIFALLFGFTFALQEQRQQQRGANFRARFAWRLTLLLGFGVINATIFQGDILMNYAITGVILIAFCKAGSRTVLIAAATMLAQPLNWYHLVDGLLHPVAKLPDPASWAYFGKANDYMANGSIFQVWLGNLTTGRHAIFLHTCETGRLFQTAGLFLLGMLAGRHGLFAQTDNNQRRWIGVLLVAPLVFILLHLITPFSGSLLANESARRPVTDMIGTWANLSLMLTWVSGFVLAFQLRSVRRLLVVLAPLGRMSLTNYVSQSLIGTTVYYGFGLGLYRFCGATLSLATGLVLITGQLLFCAWWLKRHQQGPLEALWHRATWLGGHPAKVTSERALQEVSLPR